MEITLKRSGIAVGHPLCLALVGILAGCGGPSPEQSAAQAEFLSFVGLQHGDTRDDLIEVLGPYLDDGYDLRADSIMEFFGGGVEVSLDSVDAVTRIELDLSKASENFDQIIDLDPKIERLIGTTADDILQMLGPIDGLLFRHIYRCMYGVLERLDVLIQAHDNRRLFRPRSADWL